MINFRFLNIAMLAMLSCCLIAPVWAQEDKIEIEVDTAEIEAMAEEIEAHAEEIGAAIEKWVQDNEGNLEAWAEKYASQWEAWAEKFEYNMEKWAEQQERVWEDWASKYEQKWEQWGQKLESGEFDPGEFEELMSRNMEMLGDMPLGELIEGFMENSADQLKDAPWESLGELQEMIQESVERSIAEAEGEVARATEKAKREGANTEFILPVVEKLQESIAKKQEVIDAVSKKRLAEIKERLKKAEDLDEGEVKKLVDELLKERLNIDGMREKVELRARSARNRAQAEERRAQAQAERAREQAVRAAERARRASRAKRGEAAENAERAAAARSKASDALKSALKQMESKGGEAGVRKEVIEKIASALEKERGEIESRDDELKAMRDEIRRLREELRELKKRDR